MVVAYSLGISPKDLREVYAEAERLGCTLSVTRSKHVKVVLPNGHRLQGPLTSSSWRAALTLRSRLRRAGLAI